MAHLVCMIYGIKMLMCHLFTYQIIWIYELSITTTYQVSQHPKRALVAVIHTLGKCLGNLSIVRYESWIIMVGTNKIIGTVIMVTGTKHLVGTGM